MTFLRRLSSALGHLSERLQGQDVERRSATADDRLGGDYTAMMRAHQSQGISRIGFGR